MSTPPPPTRPPPQQRPLTGCPEAASGRPAKHQLAIMIWVAVFPTLTVLNLTIGPWLRTPTPSCGLSFWPPSPSPSSSTASCRDSTRSAASS